MRPLLPSAGAGSGWGAVSFEEAPAGELRPAASAPRAIAAPEDEPFPPPRDEVAPPPSNTFPRREAPTTNAATALSAAVTGAPEFAADTSTMPAAAPTTAAPILRAFADVEGERAPSPSGTSETLQGVAAPAAGGDAPTDLAPTGGIGPIPQSRNAPASMTPRVTAPDALSEAPSRAPTPEATASPVTPAGPIQRQAAAPHRAETDDTPSLKASIPVTAASGPVAPAASQSHPVAPIPRQSEAPVPHDAQATRTVGPEKTGAPSKAAATRGSGAVVAPPPPRLVASVNVPANPAAPIQRQAEFDSPGLAAPGVAPTVENLNQAGAAELEVSSLGRDAPPGLGTEAATPMPSAVATPSHERAAASVEIPGHRASPIQRWQAAPSSPGQVESEAASIIEGASRVAAAELAGPGSGREQAKVSSKVPTEAATPATSASPQLPGLATELHREPDTPIQPKAAASAPPGPVKPEAAPAVAGREIASAAIPAAEPFSAAGSEVSPIAPTSAPDEPAGPTRVGVSSVVQLEAAAAPSDRDPAAPIPREITRSAAPAPAESGAETFASPRLADALDPSVAGLGPAPTAVRSIAGTAIVSDAAAPSAAAPGRQVVATFLPGDPALAISRQEARLAPPTGSDLDATGRASRPVTPPSRTEAPAEAARPAPSAQAPTLAEASSPIRRLAAAPTTQTAPRAAGAGPVDLHQDATVAAPSALPRAASSWIDLSPSPLTDASTTPIPRRTSSALLPPVPARADAPAQGPTALSDPAPTWPTSLAAEPPAPTSAPLTPRGPAEVPVQRFAAPSAQVARATSQAEPPRASDPTTTREAWPVMDASASAVASSRRDRFAVAGSAAARPSPAVPASPSADVSVVAAARAEADPQRGRHAEGPFARHGPPPLIAPAQAAEAPAAATSTFRRREAVVPVTYAATPSVETRAGASLGAASPQAADTSMVARAPFYAAVAPASREPSAGEGAIEPSPRRPVAPAPAPPSRLMTGARDRAPMAAPERMTETAWRSRQGDATPPSPATRNALAVGLASLRPGPAYAAAASRSDGPRVRPHGAIAESADRGSDVVDGGALTPKSGLLGASASPQRPARSAPDSAPFATWTPVGASLQKPAVGPPAMLTSGSVASDAQQLRAAAVRPSPRPPSTVPAETGRGADGATAGFFGALAAYAEPARPGRTARGAPHSTSVVSPGPTPRAAAGGPTETVSGAEPDRPTTPAPPPAAAPTFAQAPARAPPRASAPPQAADAAPIIRIDIGRIRVDGPSAPPPARRFARPKPAMGLTEYRTRRGAGVR